VTLAEGNVVGDGEDAVGRNVVRPELVSLKDFREEITWRQRESAFDQRLRQHPFSGFGRRAWSSRNHSPGSGAQEAFRLHAAEFIFGGLAWPTLSLDFTFAGSSLGLLYYLLHLLFHPLFSDMFNRISGGTLDLFAGSLSRIQPNRDKWGRSGK
jgi:hypothetical protein